jgi:hypothetical protein
LRVSPSVKIEDEAVAVEFVLQALEAVSAGGSLTQSIWRQAGTLRIRREAPTITGRGKLMPLTQRARKS